VTRRKKSISKTGRGKPLSAHEAGKLSARVREEPAATQTYGARTSSREEELLDTLTTTEMEVLALMAERLSNETIAQRRNVGLSTIEKHIENIYPKLLVNSRADAVALYLHAQQERSRRELTALRRENARLTRENAALQTQIRRLRGG
jgi:ATP/maltotriose-dependent transcriptional regulator MalT